MFVGDGGGRGVVAVKTGGGGKVGVIDRGGVKMCSGMDFVVEGGREGGG